MPGDVIHPTIFAAGYKGPPFVIGLLQAGIRPQRVVTYRQAGDVSNAFDRLCELRRSHGIRVEEDRHPRIEEDQLVFLVGWQFLLRDGLDRCIVLHDSLLPHLRGFSPTVTALLLDSPTTGVTAIRPDRGPDTGAICGSRTVRIAPGSSLRAVFDLQAQAMVDLAVEILRNAASGTLVEQPQNHSAATHSLWRDEYDYFVDWRSNAATILRHVQACSFPYAGAKGVLDGQIVTIKKASLGPDLSFAIRDPGKLWQVDGRRALVVCGSGTLWIEEASDDGGSPFHFKNLRVRFLTAETAWIAPFLRQTSRP